MNLVSRPARGFAFSNPSTVWRLFGTVIVADRSGKLTQALIENGILEYLTNSLKTDPALGHGAIGLGALVLLFIRSRHTCALISNFMSPSAANIFIQSQPETSGYSSDVVMGAVAAITASQFMYPGAQSEALPRFSTEKLAFETSNFDQVSRPRPGDFQCAMVEQSYFSLHVAGYIANDNFDTDESKELEVEKNRYNLDHREPCRSTPIELEEGEDEDGGLDRILNILIDQAEVYNMKKRIEMEQKSNEEEKPRLYDAQHEFFLQSNDRMVDRFAAAEEEWHMFIVLTGAACENVLHRALLRMTLDRGDIKSLQWDANGSGYWTIDEPETHASIRESAARSQGVYSTFVGHQNVSGRDTATLKEDWKKRHFFEFEEAMVSEDGVFEARISRENGTSSWLLRGVGLPLGYYGSIQTKLDDDNMLTIGGFILLKPESVDPSVIGKKDLNAYERLAYTSLKVGPLALSEHSAYPPLADDADPESRPDVYFENVQSESGTASSLLVNDSYHLVVSHNPLHFNQFRFDPTQSALAWCEEIFEHLFVHDPYHELSTKSPWYIQRYGAAFDYYVALLHVRAVMSVQMATEVGTDRQALEAIFSAVDNPVLLFEPDSSRVSDVEKLEKIDDDLWRNALLIHFKWVVRFSIWESAGMDIVNAVKFTLYLLSREAFQ